MTDHVYSDQDFQKGEGLCIGKDNDGCGNLLKEGEPHNDHYIAIGSSCIVALIATMIFFLADNQKFQENTASAHVTSQKNLPRYGGIRITFHAQNQDIAIKFEEKLQRELTNKKDIPLKRFYKGSLSNTSSGRYVIDFIPDIKIHEYLREELSK